MTQLTQQIVRELISYDPETGVARWKPRSAKWFKEGRCSPEVNAKWWNDKFSGKEISYISRQGYIKFSLLSKHLLLHRVIWLYMTGENPNQVDHINRNKQDNRWCNLRNVDQFENMKNLPLSKSNTSNTCGVTWHKRDKVWQSYIKVNSKNIYLGSYKDKMDAIKARKDAEIECRFHPNHGR